MSAPILATKLYVPPLRPKIVLRPRLHKRLNMGLHRKLTLVSAPAGFGKTTVVSGWIANCGRPAVWLSLDERDNDLERFLTYLVAALQTISPSFGESILHILQAPEQPSTDTILTILLNEIATIAYAFILVLDDYHTIQAASVDNTVSFLLAHLPPQMHLVITSRENPRFPLARLRARGQLSELRAADLRFRQSEAAEFLNRMMGLKLSAENIATLEARTEGWITGLQLASLALTSSHEEPTTSTRIQSFSGSHHFVLDYLVEEVLQRQPEHVQTFLLHTSILDRLCGSLCDAILCDPSIAGQTILEQIEHANLFIVPLDNKRRWYRYHHLFAELLRQRLQQRVSQDRMNELHIQASRWYEANGLDIEAFHHAAAANDVARAERLIEGNGMPLSLRGGSVPILNWLASLPTTTLNARPSLWTTYASTLMIVADVSGVEQKLKSAESALQMSEPNDRTQDLIGRIAAIRASLAAIENKVETTMTQSRDALANLNPNNLSFRAITIWTQGAAHRARGDYVAAGESYSEAIRLGQLVENNIVTIAASIGLGRVQEAENKLYLAAQNYERVLTSAEEAPRPVLCEAYLGLARLSYEWNALDAAQQYEQQARQLARRFEKIGRIIDCDLFLARLKLAQGTIAEAVAILAKVDQTIRQHNFTHRLPDVAAAQVRTLLLQGNVATAAHLAQTYKLPMSQARVHLAKRETRAAFALLKTLNQQGRQDKQLKTMILQATLHHLNRDKKQARQLLSNALALAESNGFVRLFVDEGVPMAQLLSEIAGYTVRPTYIAKLLAAFKVENQPISTPRLVDPLSERELEVLQLIAQGLSNREIGKQLFLALNTVKGHNRKIFAKLQVQRRTEAVARARELSLL